MEPEGGSEGWVRLAGEPYERDLVKASGFRHFSFSFRQRLRLQGNEKQ